MYERLMINGQKYLNTEFIYNFKRFYFLFLYITSYNLSVYLPE